MKDDIGLEELNSVKLIIWDLDDTLWQGTLSEGEVCVPDSHKSLIIELSKRGIINSICSKNDPLQVENFLKTEGIWDYFVFNSINWNPKGQRIQNIIKQIGLKERNVLFIDDNISNREETRYYNPEILTASEKCIERIKESITMLGKDDPNLSRLKQYKILEKKSRDRSNYTTNEGFLIDSNIMIRIAIPGLEDRDRIYELIHRTNQLNFTKERITIDELEDVLRSYPETCGCVYVQDKFGYYGMVGFYQIEQKRLRHFLFSCRTLGMGIEQWVYAYLDYPDIQIEEPVAGKIDIAGGMPDYIKKVETFPATEHENKTIVKGRVLLKGPCDLEVTASYLETVDNVDKEFNFTCNGMQIDYYNHSVNIINSVKFSESRKREIESNYSFLPRIAYDTKLFSGDYSLICLSVLMDTTLGVYHNVNENFNIAYGLYTKDITDQENLQAYMEGNIATARSKYEFTELERFGEEYEKIEYTPKDIVSNFKEIISMIHGINPKTRILIINLPELKYVPWPTQEYSFVGKEKIHREINLLLHTELEPIKNVSIIDINKYVRTQRDYYNSINHYSKEVYYKLALEIREAFMSLDMKADTKSVWRMQYENIRYNLRKLKYKFLVKDRMNDM